ncbi:MAG: LON peptidase substrate-binding domain-containing protein [bacterium]|nr:LON peptidase substrate-binding domain-containing protein [bacterium]
MYKLPLFPLNTVLFPTTPIRLHIFEERYRLMIGRCIEEQQPFGVVALESGEEVERFGGEAVPHLIGCTAVITEHQRLYDGRMNIVAVGHERFRILQLDHEQPYLQGVVEILSTDMGVNVETQRASNRLRRWVERYFKLLGRAENVELDTDRIPHNPVELAYLSASVLRISVPEKQELLAAQTILELIQRLHPRYRKETTLLDLLLSTERVREEGPFSLN